MADRKTTRTPRDTHADKTEREPGPDRSRQGHERVDEVENSRRDPRTDESKVPVTEDGERHPVADLAPVRLEPLGGVTVPHQDAVDPAQPAPGVTIFGPDGIPQAPGAPAPGTEDGER